MRETVASSLEDRNLDDLFADVEVFLITFPDTSKVKDAAVSLVVSVMKAIEDAIGFFLSNQGMCVCFNLRSFSSGYNLQLASSSIQSSLCFKSWEIWVSKAAACKFGSYPKEQSETHSSSTKCPFCFHPDWAECHLERYVVAVFSL